MKNYSKIFKLAMWVLLAISVAILVIGFVVGFEKNDNALVNVLFYWTYAMLAIALLAVVVFGAWIGFKNNGVKMLKKIGIILAGIAVVCAIAYLLAPGKPAVGMLDQPSDSTLKLTDTILNLTYICGAGAILSILVGEIVLAVRNKK